MQTVSLREKVVEIIENADEPLLLQIINLATEYERQEMSGEDELNLLELKRITQLRKKGGSKSYSWPEAKAIIISRRKLRE